LLQRATLSTIATGRLLMRKLLPESVHEETVRGCAPGRQGRRPAKHRQRTPRGRGRLSGSRCLSARWRVDDLKLIEREAVKKVARASIGPAAIFGAGVGGQAPKNADQPDRGVSSGRPLCRTDPEWRQARRPSRAATDQIRAGDQPQDCEGAWPRSAGDTACPCRRGDRMNAQIGRREFITLLGGAAAWPLAARAQQPGMLPTIGYWGSATPATQGQWVAAFVQRLRELGWIEGRTIAIEYRWAEGRAERAAEIAAELVQRKVDVIVTSGTAVVVAAMQATSVIPIVFAAAGGPVRTRPIASLARPGGNVTGLSNQVLDLAGKRLELLREIVPGLGRLALLGNVGNPVVVLDMREAQAAARTLGLEVTTLEIRRGEDIVPA